MLSLIHIQFSFLSNKDTKIPNTVAKLFDFFEIIQLILPSSGSSAPLYESIWNINGS